MSQPCNGGLGVQQDSDWSLISHLLCYLECSNNSKKLCIKDLMSLAHRDPPVFQAPPGSCHASPAPHLSFSNLDPSDQIASPGERDCAAARASGPGSTFIWPGNWLLVVCVMLSKPSDGSADRILASCRARCCPRDQPAISCARQI